MLIEKEQFNNLSTNNLKPNMKIPLEPIKLENIAVNYESEINNEIKPMIPSKKVIKIKRLNRILNSSQSSKNIYEKAKQYELDKKLAEKNNEKKITMKEKLNENSFSNFRLFPNKLFTDEEKTIFKNYKFIPDEEIINCENKYKIKLEQTKKIICLSMKKIIIMKQL